MELASATTCPFESSSLPPPDLLEDRRICRLSTFPSCCWSPPCPICCCWRPPQFQVAQDGDRTNAEDAILPILKLHTQEKKRKHGVTKPSGDKPAIDTTARLTEKIDLFGRSGITIDANLPRKKIRAHLRSLKPEDACKLLRISSSNELILRWIYCILVIHGRFISSEKPRKLISNLEKVEKIANDVSAKNQDSASALSDEEEQEEIDEMVYGEDLWHTLATSSVVVEFVKLSNAERFDKVVEYVKQYRILSFPLPISSLHQVIDLKVTLRGFE